MDKDKYDTETHTWSLDSPMLVTYIKTVLFGFVGPRLLENFFADDSQSSQAESRVRLRFAFFKREFKKFTGL